MPIHNPSGFFGTDNGTTVLVQYGSTKLFRVVKTTGQFQILGGYDSDVTL